MKTIQDSMDYRIVLPFGLNVRLGDVLSVGDEGRFRQETTTHLALGLEPGEPRESESLGDYYRQSQSGSSCAEKLSGQLSTTFPELPEESVGVDLSFQSAYAWVLAAAAQKTWSIEDLDRFRDPILRAYGRGTWRPDWVMVTDIVTADRFTLFASEAKDSKIALTFAAETNVPQTLTGKLTGDFSIARASEHVTTWVQRNPGAFACRALRVKSHWWGGTNIGNLAGPPSASLQQALDASKEDFWEDADE
jgi:hypothetical protein